MEKEPLEHAIRCWHAEEENARRIAGRKTLLVGVPAGFLAFLGASVDHVEQLVQALSCTASADRWWAALFGLSTLGVGLLSFFLSVGYAIGVRRGDSEHAWSASRRMHPLTSKAITLLASADEKEARRIAFTRTIAAARTLLDMNRDVENRLYQASGWLLSGVAFTFLASLAYYWVVR